MSTPASNQETLLEVQGLQAGYGDVQVLWGVDLPVPLGRAGVRGRTLHACANRLTAVAPLGASRGSRTSTQCMRAVAFVALSM